MKFEEVLPELREGKKVRIKDWFKGEYIYFNKNKVILNQDDTRIDTISYFEIIYKDWEIYEEPLLTEDEKEFIKSVLSFINNKKIELIKIEYDELICLYRLCFENAGNIVKCRFCFNDRELFKNLKLNYYYTLKELGLDD